MFTKVINWTLPPACRGTDTPQATSDVGTRALGGGHRSQKHNAFGEGGKPDFFLHKIHLVSVPSVSRKNIYKGLEEGVSEFCLSHGFPCRDRVHLRQRLLDEAKKIENSKPLTNRKFGSAEDQD